MQLHLSFLDIPVPETCVWERLSDEHKTAVIETLKRLMIQATAAHDHKENSHD